MGRWNETCALTGLPIQENEVAFIGTKFQFCILFWLTLIPSWIIVQSAIYIFQIVFKVK